MELWSEGDQYAIRQDDGALTVNNGERKWQVRPQNKEVDLLPLVPDPTRKGLDLREEAKRAKQYPHTVAGTGLIAGHQATKLEITPPGGLTYYLWVDAATGLPVQLQTAMQNALQTTYTFVSFEPNKLAADLILPDTDQDLANKAQVKVPVDLEIARADQQQVDRGSSPWQLDPLQVALTFVIVNLKVSPAGIQGEPQIPMLSFKVAASNGIAAVVEIAGAPITKVYLKRLIRQDETGIWSVVGYDR